MLEEKRGQDRIERSRRHITRRNEDKEGIEERDEVPDWRKKEGKRRGKRRDEKREGQALAPLGTYHLLRSNSSSAPIRSLLYMYMYLLTAFRSHTDTTLIRVRLTYCLIIGPPIEQHEGIRGKSWASQFSLLTIPRGGGGRDELGQILPRRLLILPSFLINTVLQISRCYHWYALFNSLPKVARKKEVETLIQRIPVSTIKAFDCPTKRATETCFQITMAAN